MSSRKPPSGLHLAPFAYPPAYPPSIAHLDRRVNLSTPEDNPRYWILVDGVVDNISNIIKKYIKNRTTKNTTPGGECPLLWIRPSRCPSGGSGIPGLPFGRKCLSGQALPSDTLCICCCFPLVSALLPCRTELQIR